MRSQLRELYARLTAGGSTEEQAVQSGIWVAGINVTDRILQLIKVIILTRLLSPAAFGLLGIALLTLAALKQLSRIGFDQALIHDKNENIDEYLNTAWVIKGTRGVLIGLIAFVSAPYLAVFFNEPEAEQIIQVLGFAPLLLGLQNPAVVYFQKNLDFHKEFLYKVGGRLVDLTVAVVFAFVFRNVWSLVAGFIASRLTMLGLSYIIHQYRPRVEVNWGFAKEMFGFGKWIFLSGIMTFLYGQGDDAFVGWFFTATTLGFYQIAYQFSNAPATEVTHVISRVAFPALSKVQDDPLRLKEGYFRAVQLSTVIGFPMAAGTIAIAPQFVNTVFGSEWTPMIPLIQILGLWGAQRSLGANIGPVFKAVGRPDINTKLQALKVMLIAVLIYPAAEQFGVIGVGYVLVGNTFLTLPLGMYVALTIVSGSVSRLLVLISPPLIASSIMAISVITLDMHVFQNTGILQLTVLILTGAVVYFGLMLTFDKTTEYEFIGLYRHLSSLLH